ncbi:MAG: hypothetical protein J6T57_02495 [Alphaproteobacteria bacterium]|nr:hypothetical protein [Alphaproteobacteria bacterium]
MSNKKLIDLLLIAAGGLMLSGCSSQGSENQDEDEQATEAPASKKQEVAKFKDFKARMQTLTPQIMLETILAEGTKLDEKGLCKPYQDSKGVWTIGFGLTQLDGKAVTQNTRHITLREAYEKAAAFYEERETFFFMWCYEVGIDALEIDTEGKAFCLASIIYNSCTNIIENPSDKQHCNRNAELRALYAQYGDDVTADQVAALFAKYPITAPTSFGRVLLNGGSTKAWANTLGGFTKEGGGIYWRRWLEGQMAMGNIKAKDLLDLPMGCMYDFWRCIGHKKSALFTKRRDGTWQVNPDALVKFKEWVKNPVDEHGNTINRKTLRQLLNEMDPTFVTQIETGKFEPVQKTDTISFAVAEQLHTCGDLNDSSLFAYRDGDYETALELAKAAYKIAQTNKEIGASTYNIGMAYLAMEKYERAVKYLRLSLAVNKTKDAEDALKEATQKRNSTRTKWAGYGLLGTGAFTVALIARRRSMMQRQKHR